VFRAGMDIIDAIKECSSNVITHNIGSCYSMAAIIFQAGDERLISKHASIMIHIGDEGYDSAHPKNLETWMKENKRLGDAADDILFKRIRQKKPRFKKEKFDELLIFDTIYDAKKAIEMGLADKIAEHKELV
jgi:ATP-dependent protease ClpP protease subunit